MHAAVAAQRARGLVLDGELVAFDGEETSFVRLQQRLGVCEPCAALVAAYPVIYCLFDLLEQTATTSPAVRWLSVALRQPRFLGLRDDKYPTGVVRERSG